MVVVLLDLVQVKVEPGEVGKGKEGKKERKERKEKNLVRFPP